MGGNDAWHVMSTQHMVLELIQTPENASSQCPFLFYCPGARNPQETTLQPQSALEAPACSQAAGAKSSSSSEYFTCVSSQSKRPCPDQDGKEYKRGDLSLDKRCSWAAQPSLYFVHILFKNRKEIQGR